MTDQFDVSLQDDELLAEVELTAELMAAANSTEQHLDQRAIDELLGLS